MRRNRLQWLRRVLTAACLLSPALSQTAVAEPLLPQTSARPNPPAAAAEDPVVNVFLNGPSDLNVLWKSLARPDFVILRGDEYARLRRAEAGGAAVPPPWSAVVRSVIVRGTVRDDLAALSAEFGVTVAAEGPTWIPLRLDGQTLTGAKEHDRELHVQVGEGGTWQVELTGRGPHDVTVGLMVPVRLGPEGKRIDLAIPEAASTRFAIDVPQRVTEAHAGPTEPVAHESRGEVGLTRLAADLSPRSRLAVSWKVEEEAGASLPPLLVVQGEIAVDVETGTFRTRSSWSIRSVRGASRSLQFKLDPEDEVLEVELDGQTPPAGIEHADGATRMTIPLIEPLGPGQERRLVMTTRRPTASNASARVTFSGFPLINANEQAGVIAVAQGGNLFVSGVPGRGVRRIDPRTELPADLRARPATVLAYQFSEQPFELALRVEPSPPLVGSEARTTVALEPGSARVDTWLDYQITRGRPDDLSLAIPPGLEIDSVGPEDVVSSWQSGLVPSVVTPGGAAVGFRYLTVRVAPKGPDGARFTLHVTGHQATEHNREVAVGLIQPVGVVSGGGRIAVLTDPSLTTELVEPSGNPTVAQAFRIGQASPPADWPWPPGRSPNPQPALWLRYAGSPASLPLLVQTHPLMLGHATTLQVRVDRREAVVQQETEVTVRFGAIDHVDVIVPAALEGRWEDDGAGVVARTALGHSVKGGRAYRLKLQGELTRSTRLRFRYRLPLPERPEPDHPIDVEVPWIRPLATTGSSTSVLATASAESGLELSTRPGAWSVASGTPDNSERVAEPGDSAERVSLSRHGADTGAPLGLRVTARALAILPNAIVPRLGLRTLQMPEGKLRTTAWFGVETQERSLSLALPTGAELEWARVGGESVRQVEPLPRGAGIRVGLPTRSEKGPVLVELEYTVRPSRSGAALEPPRLLDGGLVQQTLWEVRLPWNQALVGVPADWSDENEWYWATYVWKRRPWRTTAELSSWASGGASGSKAAADADDQRGDYHAYLFGRPGPPAELAVTVVSRAWLVALCSGSVLAVGGVLIMCWRPSMTLAWLAALLFLLAVGVLLHPSVTLLAVQSAELGLVLTVLLAVMHRVVERRRPAPAVFGEPSALTPPVAPGSTFNRVVGVGSDDSTAIRTRPTPVSTMDYRPLNPQTTPPPGGDGDADADRTSRQERVGREGASP